MVFQTAPPQPASKARRTWYSELVGGPDASQNGLGALTPQNSMLRSGTRYSLPLRDESDFSAASIPHAATFPSCTASTISPPPRTQSPPAYNRGTLVAPVARSTTT